MTMGAHSRVEGLRAAYWRRRALKVETDAQADLAEAFGLTPSQAKVLALLYDQKGEWVLSWRIAKDAGLSERTRAVAVMMAELRKRLECEAIDSERGIPGGYRLTEVGLEECDRAFTAMRERVAG